MRRQIKESLRSCELNDDPRRNAGITKGIDADQALARARTSVYPSRGERAREM